MARDRKRLYVVCVKTQCTDAFLGVCVPNLDGRVGAASVEQAEGGTSSHRIEDAAGARVEDKLGRQDNADG